MMFRYFLFLSFIIFLMSGCQKNKNIIDSPGESTVSVEKIYQTAYSAPYNGMDFDEPYLYVAAGKEGLWRLNVRNSNSEGEFIQVTDSSGKLLEIYDVDAHKNSLIISSDKGIWVSEDGGATWFQSDFQKGAYFVKRSPNYPDTALTSVNGYAIFRSLDGGKSWQKTFGDENTGAFPDGIYWNPYQPGEVWIALTTGFDKGRLYQAVDFGASKGVEVNLDQLVGDSYLKGVYRVAFCKEHPNWIYIGITGSGIFKSEDDGVSWHQVSLPEDLQIIDFVIDPENDRRFYLSVKRNQKDYIYYSSDALQSVKSLIEIEAAGQLLLDRSGEQLFVGSGSGIFRISLPGG